MQGIAFAFAAGLLFLLGLLLLVVRQHLIHWLLAIFLLASGALTYLLAFGSTEEGKLFALLALGVLAASAVTVSYFFSPWEDLSTWKNLRQ